MTERAENATPRSRRLFCSALKKGITDIEDRISDLQHFDLSTITELGNPRVTKLKNNINSTIADIFGHGTVEYNDYAILSLSDLTKKMEGKHSLSKVHSAYQRGINDAIKELLSVKATLKSILDAIWP